MRVRWDKSLSDSFSVSNGVRQGGVLSPILLTLGAHAQRGLQYLGLSVCVSVC